MKNVLALPRVLRLTALGLALTALGTLGCVDAPKAGDTSGTTLYVFDAASKSVKVWADVNTLYDAPTAVPAPGREISGSAITNVATLGWGGMALDTSGNRLYLVSETGDVARIEKARTANGALSQFSDLAGFSLGNSSTDRFSSGSLFGQASVGNNVLYVTEYSKDGLASRLWRVNDPGSVMPQTNVPRDSSVVTVPDAGDKNGTGVAAGQGSDFFAFFGGGKSVFDTSGTTATDGPRMRYGNGTFTQMGNVVIGLNSKLGTSDVTTYGTMGFDRALQLLYVARQWPNSGEAAVMVFTQSQFNQANANQAPSRVLPETVATLPNLRFITHGGTKDWLVGGDRVGDAGTNILRLWKTPSAGTASVPVNLGASVVLRGLALDGNN